MAASFFFARPVAHRNEAKYPFPTIAVQIALSVPENTRGPTRSSTMIHTSLSDLWVPLSSWLLYSETALYRHLKPPRHSQSSSMVYIPRPWPSEDIIRRLVRKSGGYFIYASTAIEFIDEEYESPAARLDQLLGNSNSSSDMNPLISCIFKSCRPTPHHISPCSSSSWDMW